MSVSVDLHLFEVIIPHTLVVLGSSADKHGERQNNLAVIRNQATAKGDPKMGIFLLVELIGLPDAGAILLGEGI